MALPPHATEWMNRAEIDYIGPFIKAWTAFNAWFRHASAQQQERAMLDWVKGQPNPVRRGVLALLRNDSDTAEAQALKLAISDLQIRLDGIHFEVTRKGVNEQICAPQRLHRAQKLQSRADRTQRTGIQGRKDRRRQYSDHRDIRSN